MAQEYIVERVLDREEWDGNRGRMATYELMLAGEQQTVKLSQMAKTDAPEQGGTLFGHLEGGKFKKDQRQNGAGQKGEKSYERQPDHPINTARALHTSVMSSAPAYYELLRTEGVIDKAADKAAALNTLAGIMEWLKSGYPPEVLARAHPSDDDIKF